MLYAFSCTHCECPHTFAETNKYMKNKIDELTIRCIYCYNGCTYFCKVNSIEKHEKTCEFKLMICQSKNCIQDSNSSEIKHAKDCGLYPINCEICKKSMRLMEVFFNNFFFLIKSFIFFCLQRKTHRCIDHLLEKIDNLERNNKNMVEENIELRNKNEKSRFESNRLIGIKEKTWFTHPG